MLDARLWCAKLGLDALSSASIPKTHHSVESCNYCCYVRCATLIIRVGENASAINRRNSLPCTVKTSKQRSCNQRVGCVLLYVVVWLRSMIYGMGLWTSARCQVWFLVVVRIAMDLQYSNIPWIHITSNI